MKVFIPVFALVTACGHDPAVARIPSSPEAIESFVTVRTHPDGSPRQVVVEDVLPADRSCEPRVFRQYNYDVLGQLERHVVEFVRCGVTESRVVELVRGGATVSRRYTFLDEDRDGTLELADLDATNAPTPRAPQDSSSSSRIEAAHLSRSPVADSTSVPERPTSSTLSLSASRARRSRLLTVP